jgi:hypothetical protein
MSLLTKALVGLFFAASSVVAQPQTLTIVLPAAAPPTESVLAEMKRESARLLAPAGYSLAWLSRSATTLGDSFEQLVVVKFKGACTLRVEDETAPLLQAAGSLATTAVSNGQVLPFVEVDCDRTRRLLAPAIISLPAGARQTLFGRAIGRVLAHEFYHVLAQTTVHKDQGASKPCFRMADLISANFHFDAVSLAQMRPVQLARESQAGDIDVAADDAAGR